MHYREDRYMGTRRQTDVFVDEFKEGYYPKACQGRIDLAQSYDNGGDFGTQDAKRKLYQRFIFARRRGVRLPDQDS